MNNCVKLAMLEVSNFYLFQQPVCISLEMDTGCRPSQPPPTPYCIQFSANLWWDQAFIVHIVYSPLQTYSVYILYIVLCKHGGIRPSVCILYTVLCKPIQCTYCIQFSANLWLLQAFSVHIVYSPLQTYSVYILYIVLCKPMVASGLQCAYCTVCSPLQTYVGIMP